MRSKEIMAARATAHVMSLLASDLATVLLVKPKCRQTHSSFGRPQLHDARAFKRLICCTSCHATGFKMLIFSTSSTSHHTREFKTLIFGHPLLHDTQRTSRSSSSHRPLLHDMRGGQRETHKAMSASHKAATPSCTATEGRSSNRQALPTQSRSSLAIATCVRAASSARCSARTYAALSMRCILTSMNVGTPHVEDHFFS